MALVRRLAIRYAFAMPDVESLLGEIAALRMMVVERDARLAELASIDVQLQTARLESKRHVGSTIDGAAGFSGEAIVGSVEGV